MPSSPFTGSQVVARARTRTTWDKGMCLSAVRQAWGLPKREDDAHDAWEHSSGKHYDTDPGKIPAGAPICYAGGQHGHIVLNVPGPDMRSTDCQSTGQVSEAAYDWPTRHWGSAYKMLGWLSELNGYTLRFDDPPAPEDDMPTAQEIAQAVWEYPIANTQGAQYSAATFVQVASDAPAGTINYPINVDGTEADFYTLVVDTRARVMDLQNRVAALEQR